MMSNHQLESFEELLDVVRARAREGEMFFRMDVRPAYPDTPDNWEERLEAAFTGL